MRKKQVYTYEQNRDLLTQVQNYINGGVISQYDYVNDAIGRRTAITRSGSMMSETRTDCYGYNDRNELTNAVKNATLNEYTYQYDDIGNRISSLDLGTNRTYTANELNQYTNIVDGVDGFLPEFDLDGNQTLVKTSTGVWSVSYNGENRPVLWECGTTNIVMKFDRMGRRVEYIETVSGVTNAHHRFVYDGYLCIQRLNAASNNAIDLVFGWDPSEPVATRPLVLQKYGQYSLFYTHDGNKNVSELVFFQQANGIAAHYEYAPFGAVTATSRSTPVTTHDFCEHNPFRFSSEYADDVLGIVYYNYRHYNPNEGRWCGRDIIEELGGLSLYVHCNNSLAYDFLGLEEPCCCKVCVYSDCPSDVYRQTEPVKLDEHWDGHTWLTLEDCDSPDDEFIFPGYDKIFSFGPIRSLEGNSEFKEENVKGAYYEVEGNKSGHTMVKKCWTLSSSEQCEALSIDLSAGENEKYPEYFSKRNYCTSTVVTFAHAHNVQIPSGISLLQMPVQAPQIGTIWIVVPAPNPIGMAKALEKEGGIIITE